MVKQLLATDGVNLDSKDTEHGRTPLSWATANEHETVVKQLLETNGVDLTPRTSTIEHGCRGRQRMGARRW